MQTLPRGQGQVTRIAHRTLTAAEASEPANAIPQNPQKRYGAGRFRRITLRPMTLEESGESSGAVSFAELISGGVVAGIGGPAVEEYASVLVRGGWPSLVAQPNRSPQDYLDSYLDDIPRVALPEVGIRADPLRVRALIRALARNTSTEISIAKLSREAEIGVSGTEVSAQTARRYLDALARVFVVEEQQAWAPHLRSKVRLRAQPKWHFVDPSLAAAALGAGGSALLDDLNTFGLLFESLCIRDLRVLSQPSGGTVYHYRDENGLEIDAVVELNDGRWAAFEVKVGGSKNIDMAATNLRSLAAKVSEQRADQLASLNVLTAGTASYTREDGVNVIALGHLAP